MRHKRRWAVVGGVAGLLIAVVVGGGLFADELVREGIERGVRGALGVETRVGSVAASLIGGRVEFDGLEVANPPAYEQEHFLRIERGSASLVLSSLLADVVRMPVVRLHGLDLRLEDVGGHANYRVLLDHLAGRSVPASADGGRKFVIDELVIDGATVAVFFVPVAGEARRITVPIDRIELAGVGTDGNEIPIGKVTEIVVSTVIATVLENFGETLPEEVREALTAAANPLQTARELGARLEVTAEGAARTVIAAASRELEQAAAEALQRLLGRGGAKRDPGPRKRDQR